MNRLGVLAAALAASGEGGYDRPDVERPRSRSSMRMAIAGRNRREARRLNRRARKRRFVRSQQRLDELRGQINLGQLKPVHPRDRYWYGVGLQGGQFTLQPPNGGGSYYARYRAMHEAGAKARKEALS